MTGYAIATAPGPVAVSVELRGVNSRFLDLSFRIPDELRALEPALRDLLRNGLQRGKVECRVSWQPVASNDGEPDPETLAALARSLRALRRAIPEIGMGNATDLLRTPGLLAPAADPADVREPALAAARIALAAFIDARASEGRALAAIITERLDGIGAIARQLRARAPELMIAYEARLAERIRNLLESIPGADTLPANETMTRVRQEVAAFGLRADVAEEIDRLEAHLTEFRKRLAEGGPAGKRLDFLTQELNREANTLGSKASATDFSQAAVELKVLIEQIREQVQNIE